MNHKIGRAAFASTVGLLVAYFSYQWITNPQGREERALQVSVVEASRGHLGAVTAIDGLEIVDPLSPSRSVGKVYVYPDDAGWSVSGFYRRGEGDAWHPYLMDLDADLDVISLKVQDADPRLLERAATDPRLESSP